MTLIQQLTLEELKNMIDEAVERKFQQHRWTPPPDSRSTLELLREDRDR